MINPGNPEETPVIEVILPSDDSLFLTPENSRLCTFVGQTVVDGVLVDNDTYNYIGVTFDDDPEQTEVIFRSILGDGDFERAAISMSEYDFPLYLNIRHVPDELIELFNVYQQREIDLFSSKLAELDSSTPIE